ncbi:MAG: hypothetical protein Kow00120_00630 [Anaerolineae bacterium]
MVSIFWILLGLFGVIGLLRGWAKEIIATMGLILALFALHQFGPTLFGQETLAADFVQSDLMTQPPGQRTVILPEENTLTARSTQFALQTGFLLIVAFFAYQTPTAVDFFASRGGAAIGRFSRLNVGLQNRILGLILGLVNGWLVVGSIWFFAHQMGYPFGQHVIPAPPFATSQTHVQLNQWALNVALDSAGFESSGLVGLTNALIASLPLNFIGDYLPILVVILFLFLLIAIV